MSTKKKKEKKDTPPNKTKQVAMSCFLSLTLSVEKSEIMGAASLRDGSPILMKLLC